MSIQSLLKQTNFKERIITLAQLFAKDMSEKMVHPPIYVQLVTDKPKYVVSDSVLKLNVSFSPDITLPKNLAPGKILLLQNWCFEYQVNETTKELELELMIEKFEVMSRFTLDLNDKVISFDNEPSLRSARTILRRIYERIYFNDHHPPEESIAQIKSILSRDEDVEGVGASQREDVGGYSSSQMEGHVPKYISDSQRASQGLFSLGSSQFIDTTNVEVKSYHPSQSQGDFTKKPERQEQKAVNKSTSKVLVGFSDDEEEEEAPKPVQQKQKTQEGAGSEKKQAEGLKTGKSKEDVMIVEEETHLGGVKRNHQKFTAQYSSEEVKQQGEVELPAKKGKFGWGINNLEKQSAIIESRKSRPHIPENASQDPYKLLMSGEKEPEKEVMEEEEVKEFSFLTSNQQKETQQAPISDTQVTAHFGQVSQHNKENVASDMEFEPQEDRSQLRRNIMRALMKQDQSKLTEVEEEFEEDEPRPKTIQEKKALMQLMDNLAGPLPFGSDANNHKQSREDKSGKSSEFAGNHRKKGQPGSDIYGNSVSLDEMKIFLLLMKEQSLEKLLLTQNSRESF